MTASRRLGRGDYGASTLDASPVDEARESVFAFHRAIDRGAATAAISVVAGDAVLIMGEHRLAGLQAVHRFLEQREAAQERCTVHQLTNELVLESGPDRVRFTHVLLLHLRDSEGTYRAVGAYHAIHDLRLIDDRWRIVDRRIRPLHD